MQCKIFFKQNKAKKDGKLDDYATTENNLNYAIPQLPYMISWDPREDSYVLLGNRLQKPWSCYNKYNCLATELMGAFLDKITFR